MLVLMLVLVLVLVLVHLLVLSLARRLGISASYETLSPARCICALLRTYAAPAPTYE